jgi:hypothetical protein
MRSLTNIAYKTLINTLQTCENNLQSIKKVCQSIKNTLQGSKNLVKYSLFVLYVSVLFLTFIFNSNLSLNQISQQTNTIWKILATVKISQQKDKTGKYDVSIPTFPPDLQKLHNTTIEIKGYIIPLQELRKHNEFVLSRYPYSLCYFCGGAGIETVIEVKTTKSIKFTEDAIMLRGILKLNATNPNQLLYVLEQAEEIK